MEIIIKDNKRILVQEDKTELDISNGSIIEYIGIHYKCKKDTINIYDIDEFETRFIGKIDSDRGDSKGTTGIYISPLFLWTNEWIKIINYMPPKNKYFLYPHLLMLPDKYYHHQPLYFLHTCKPVILDRLNNIIKTVELDFI